MGASIKKFTHIKGSGKSNSSKGKVREDDDIKLPSKISDEYAKHLKDVSEFNAEFESNLELLRKLRLLLLDNLKVCDGAYKAKPTQGNSYALTNMVSQIKDITDRLEEAIDYEEVTNTVINDVVKPFIEKMILDLGSIISNEIDILPKSDRKVASNTINKIYKKYGAKIETKLPELSEKILKSVLTSVK